MQKPEDTIIKVAVKMIERNGIVTVYYKGKTATGLTKEEAFESVIDLMLLEGSRIDRVEY